MCFLQPGKHFLSISSPCRGGQASASRSNSLQVHIQPSPDGGGAPLGSAWARAFWESFAGSGAVDLSLQGTSEPLSPGHCSCTQTSRTLGALRVQGMQLGRGSSVWSHFLSDCACAVTASSLPRLPNLFHPAALRSGRMYFL